MTNEEIEFAILKYKSIDIKPRPMICKKCRHYVKVDAYDSYFYACDELPPPVAYKRKDRKKHCDGRFFTPKLRIVK